MSLVNKTTNISHHPHPPHPHSRRSSAPGSLESNNNGINNNTKLFLMNPKTKQSSFRGKMKRCLSITTTEGKDHHPPPDSSSSISLLELKKENENVSAGGIIYERASSRRERHRQAHLLSTDREDAMPLGRTTSSSITKGSSGGGKSSGTVNLVQEPVVDGDEHFRQFTATLPTKYNYKPTPAKIYPKPTILKRPRTIIQRSKSYPGTKSMTMMSSTSRSKSTTTSSSSTIPKPTVAMRGTPITAASFASRTIIPKSTKKTMITTITTSTPTTLCLPRPMICTSTTNNSNEKEERIPKKKQFGSTTNTSIMSPPHDVVIVKTQLKRCTSTPINDSNNNNNNNNSNTRSSQTGSSSTPTTTTTTSKRLKTTDWIHKMNRNVHHTKV